MVVVRPLLVLETVELLQLILKKNVGSNELTFAGNGKTYVAKVNICSDKLVVRYTKAGSTDTYKKK